MNQEKKEGDEEVEWEDAQRGLQSSMHFKQAMRGHVVKDTGHHPFERSRTHRKREEWNKDQLLRHHLSRRCNEWMESNKSIRQRTANKKSLLFSFSSLEKSLSGRNWSSERAKVTLQSFRQTSPHSFCNKFSPPSSLSSSLGSQEEREERLVLLPLRKRLPFPVHLGMGCCTDAFLLVTSFFSSSPLSSSLRRNRQQARNLHLGRYDVGERETRKKKLQLKGFWFRSWEGRAVNCPSHSQVMSPFIPFTEKRETFSILCILQVCQREDMFFSRRDIIFFSHLQSRDLESCMKVSMYHFSFSLCICWSKK